MPPQPVAGITARFASRNRPDPEPRAVPYRLNLSSGGRHFKRRTRTNCEVLRFHPSHQSTRPGRSGPRSAGHPCLTSTPRPLPTRATHTNHDHPMLRVTVRTSAWACAGTAAATVPIPLNDPLAVSRRPKDLGPVSAGPHARDRSGPGDQAHAPLSAGSLPDRTVHAHQRSSCGRIECRRDRWPR